MKVRLRLATPADADGIARFYEATGWHASGEVRDTGRHVAFRRRLVVPRAPHVTPEMGWEP